MPTPWRVGAMKMWPVLFLLFDVGAGNDASAKAIADRMNKQPIWRGSFLEQLGVSRQKDPAVEHMFQLVDQGPRRSPARSCPTIRGGWREQAVTVTRSRP